MIMLLCCKSFKSFRLLDRVFLLSNLYEILLSWCNGRRYKNNKRFSKQWEQVGFKLKTSESSFVPSVYNTVKMYENFLYKEISWNYSLEQFHIDSLSYNKQSRLWKNPQKTGILLYIRNCSTNGLDLINIMLNIFEIQQIRINIFAINPVLSSFVLNKFQTRKIYI